MPHILRANVKRRWLAALRSGKYIQGKQCLRHASAIADRDKFCCLGVLCDVVAPSLWGHQSYKRMHGSGGGAAFPPPSLNDIIATKKYSMRIQANYRILAKMNDEGASFDTIADYIEEHF